MNKYQKVASQVAKDMLKKEIYKEWDYKKLKNEIISHFKERGFNVLGAINYKNYFKDKWY